MKRFYDIVRARLAGKLTQGQVNGINSILDKCSFYGLSKEQTAYVLATAWHETGGRMQPVREGFSSTDEGAVSAVERLHQRGIISKNYAYRHANGNSYYGRGHVQLTHGYNYQKAGDKLGIDLYGNPDLALDLNVSASILVLGMLEGWFTSKKLTDYINSDKVDFVEARRIVNGKDKAKLIAGYADVFLKALG